MAITIDAIIVESTTDRVKDNAPNISSMASSENHDDIVHKRA
jgi:hypothetical protein